MTQLKAPNWGLHIVGWNLTETEVEKYATQIERIFEKHLRPCAILAGESRYTVGETDDIMFSFPMEFELIASSDIPIRFEIKARIVGATGVVGKKNASAIIESALIDLVHSWDDRDTAPVFVDFIL